MRFPTLTRRRNNPVGGAYASDKPLPKATGAPPTLGNRIGGFLKGAPPRSSFDDILDPNNVDSELTPADRGIETPPADEPDSDIIALVEQRFKEGRQGRLLIERRWIYGLAMETDVNQQFLRWETQGGVYNLTSSKDANDPYRSYNNNNKIAPLTAKSAARAVQSKPDASTKPYTDSEDDKLAAEEGAAVLNYTDRKFKRQAQTLEMVRNAQSLGPPWLEIGWNPTAEADVAASFDPQTGGVQAYKKAPVGDLYERVRPSLFIITDPKGEASEECDWLIDASMESLNHIQEVYGKRGAKVPGGVYDATGYAGMLINYLAAVAGDFTSQLAPNTRKNEAMVLKMWEKPSPRYGEGRYIVVANGVLLVNIAWPYDKKDEFPYVRMPYREAIGSIYGQNLVLGLCPMQEQYNTILSRFMDRVNTDFPTVLVPKGAQIGVDAYTSPRNYRLVYHSPGMTPAYQQPPPPGDYWFKLLEILDANMEDYAGVHDVSEGTVPGGVTAGNAIELLQQADSTQAAEFSTHIEQMHTTRAEWEIALYRQFAREPRLLAVSDAADPKKVKMQAVEFKGMGAGGQCRVEVTPGSATPKSPAAEQAQIDDWLKMGVLGPPNMPSTATNYFNLREDSRVDQVTQLALQANLEFVATQKAMQTQAPQQPPPPDPVQEAQLETQSKIQVAQATAQAKSQADIATAQATAALPPKQPTVTISVKADPAGTIAAEELAFGPSLHDAAGHAMTLHATNPDAAMAAHAVQGAPPDPAEQAALTMQTNAHAANTEVAKAGALQAMQPPPPDPNEEQARQKDMATHQADQEIRVAKATPPKPAAKG